MQKTRLILVGGFLGAGKTTLLWEAASRIMNNGQHVGLVTNDQATELVDTAILSHHNVKVAEVSGSCFCCNFNGFMNAIQQVRKEAIADVIIAEPVGSCTDLSATVLQPLKEKMKTELVISPFSVLTDPIAFTNILDGGNAGLHPNAAYIYLKQIEESDILVVGKSDLLSQTELDVLKKRAKNKFPETEVMALSSKTGEGIEEWLKEVTNRTDTGKHILEVDYERYAEGEAVLGWLNSTIELSGESTNWDIYTKNLLKDLSKRFYSMGVSVGHVKIILESGCNYLIANLTGSDSSPDIRGSAGSSTKAKLTLNARVEMSTDILEQIVRDALKSNSNKNIETKILSLRCLSPGRPKPTFRFDHVVNYQE